MVTIRQVAKVAGVSVATASRALNGMANVTRLTREKIEAAAAELDYIPHNGARSLTRQRTDTIGVILPDLFGEFFSEIIRGIDDVVHQAGKGLLLGNMHGSSEETETAMRAMRGRVDGLLVMPPNGNADTIAAALANGMPTVLLHARANDGATPFVTVDNYRGAQMITEHLMERGARNIIHVSGPKDNRDAIERRRGYKDALKRLLPGSEPVVLPGNFREGAGRDAARLLLDGNYKYDAIFAANDLMAIDLMSAFREEGIEVGNDILIAGFDDIPLARYVTPQLTTVHSDISQLGSTAALMLLQILNGENLDASDGRVIQPTLALRGSTEGLLQS